MPSLRLRQVSFSYDDSRDLFTTIELHLSPGWVGVVGENGAGKTSLLQIMSGELAPTRGRVAVAPPDSIVQLCPQRVDHCSVEIASLARSFDADAARLRALLQLCPEDLERWPTLSPGQRKRWQIAAALALRPDVLLLDEPTTHIDASARQILGAALHVFSGIGVVVSHDRGFLDELTRETVRIVGSEVRSYRGCYSVAQATWTSEESRARQSAIAARDHREAAERRLAMERREHASAAAKLSTRRRMKSARDSDARSSAAKARAAKGEARASRRVCVSRALAERAAEQAASHSVAKPRGRSLFVSYQRSPNPIIARIEAQSLGYPGRPVLAEVSVVVDRDSRVHLRGDNGAGKSTLLSALFAHGARRDRLLYLPQELGRSCAAELMESVRGCDKVLRSRIFHVAAALGLDPTHALRSPQPSPGELRKLLMAQGLAREAWALLLDEPTNHLDLPSIERLQEALVAYPGALVIATHDEALAAAVTSAGWRVRAGRLEV